MKTSAKYFNLAVGP